ncbi:hypothetical protein ABCS02_30880 [Microbacterium sp. X-17]|uniref:hypothetical protein n=1 Tax=Microbacterium sp. X-17 TaxID=3144404 RepID=UPI0031F5044E
MEYFGWFGGFVLLAAAIVGLIKPVREEVVNVVRSGYLRWRPWRIVLSQDWLTRELRASLIRGDDGTEVPYVMRNRGPNRVTNVSLTHTFGKRGYLAVNIEDLAPESESKPFSFPNQGLKRIWLTVEWDEASSRSQRVRLPRFNVMTRADRKIQRWHKKGSH